MADQLRNQIDLLIQKQQKAEDETTKHYIKFKFWKNQKNEVEDEFNYKYYQTWSTENQRLGKEIQIKLKAVQKYQKNARFSLIRKSSPYGPSNDSDKGDCEFQLNIIVKHHSQTIFDNNTKKTLCQLCQIQDAYGTRTSFKRVKGNGKFLKNQAIKNYQNDQLNELMRR